MTSDRVRPRVNRMHEEVRIPTRIQSVLGRMSAHERDVEPYVIGSEYKETREGCLIRVALQLSRPRLVRTRSKVRAGARDVWEDLWIRRGPIKYLIRGKR